MRLVTVLLIVVFIVSLFVYSGMLPSEVFSEIILPGLFGLLTLAMVVLLRRH